MSVGRREARLLDHSFYGICHHGITIRAGPGGGKPFRYSLL